MEIFMSNADIHAKNSRSKSDVFLPHTRITKCQNGVYFAGIRIFNYKGRLISNAHSEISRKIDHVFKQKKVGSKVKYFSYKLTYLFFDVVALSFNTFFPTYTSLRMPSMKNSGVLCLIHDVTACFTSSSQVK